MRWGEKRYYSLDYYLKETFGEKLYKLSLNGGKRRVKVTIYPSQLPFGAVVERLRIISNDPKMPVLTMRVSAIVEG